MSVSKASVVEGSSKPHTDLKSIIGTGSRDRLHCCAPGLCGSDSIFCPWSVGSTSPKNSISESYELLILLQQPACSALIPDFAETHNYSKEDLIPPPTKNPGFVFCQYFLTKIPSLPTRPERLMGRDFNAYVMCIEPPVSYRHRRLHL